MIKQPLNTILEYIWIGGKNEIRNKTRVIPHFIPKCIDSIPNWNYDGSSTWQADSNGDTEIILKPCALFNDPFRNINNAVCYLVLCATYNAKDGPTKTNFRHNANLLFNSNTCEPWFGLEQEYFFSHNKSPSILISDGYHYCGKIQDQNERKIVEQHLEMCIKAGVKIAGLNAEVAKGQWEFQIGICEGITAGDHLIIARYILERLAETIDSIIIYHPKPTKNVNGSGCHINFSTNETRTENGIDLIYEYIKRLEDKHKQTILAYGEDNHLRLTGLHETSDINNFTWGIGTRNTSIRIPNLTFNDKSGYFEDRRPAANIDPYLATSTLFKICCCKERYELIDTLVIDC